MKTRHPLASLLLLALVSPFASAQSPCPSSLEVTPGVVHEEAGRVEIRRGARVEWLVRDDRGVEQGFTLSSPPPLPGDGPLQLVVELFGIEQVELADDARAARLYPVDGEAVVHYGGLLAYDADGVELSATFAHSANRLSIRVDDAGARFPLTIDPWIWVESHKLQGAQPAPVDDFGAVVSVSGDTVVVCAEREKSGLVEVGAAYVFVRQGTGWQQQAKLVPDDFTSAYRIRDVFVRGDDILLTTEESLGSGSHNPGHVYAFHRIGGGWFEQAKLRPNRDLAGYGIDAALDGDTAVVGLCDNTSDEDEDARVYVFERTGSTWGPPTFLDTIAPGEGDAFGNSVAIEGNRIVVGAPAAENGLLYGSGCAYVFERTGTSWTQVAEVMPPDPTGHTFHGASGFGVVAVSGDTILVGAPSTCVVTGDGGAGAAYFFDEVGGTWIPRATVVSDVGGLFFMFGRAVGLDGDLAAVGELNSLGLPPHRTGSVMTYRRQGTGWSETSRLVPSDSTNRDRFGSSISLDARRLVVGSPYFDGRKGQAYVYELTALASAQFRTDAENTNLDGYVASVPRLGADLLVTVDNSATGNIGAGVLGYANPWEWYFAGANGYALVDPSSPGGELLRLPPAFGAGPVSFTLPIPADPALLGATVATQGFGFGGPNGVTLRNAYDLFLGE